MSGDAGVRAFVGRSVGPPVPGPDPVNTPMVRHWCEAIGDMNPVYLDPQAAAASVHGGLVAPPTMLQAWTMRGLRGLRGAVGPNAQDELLALLDEAGYTSVVATNCEQHYERYLRPGDALTVSTVIEAVSEPKRTALGEGVFVSTRSTYRDADEAVVATMTFRILKFRPLPKQPERPAPPAPVVTADNAYFFEGGRAGQLLIQRCVACSELRHPPTPTCPICHSFDWDTVEASGHGTLHSVVTVHHPQVPAFDYPLPVALVDLAEGVRMVAGLVGIEPLAHPQDLLSATLAKRPGKRGNLDVICAHVARY